MKGVDDADLAISALSVREIAKGVVRLGKIEPETATMLEVRVAAIFDAFKGRILPIDRRVAEVWGTMLAASDKHSDDTGLAATAQVHGLIVVTRNIKDFRERNVVLLDPFKTRQSGI